MDPRIPALARAEDAGAVIWIAASGPVLAFWLYDTETEQTVRRSRAGAWTAAGNLA